MTTHNGMLDLSKKFAGDIGICQFHTHIGVEMEVVERFNKHDSPEYEDDDFEPEEQIWVRRTDGLPFNHDRKGNILRNNNLELVINEAWIKVTHKEWDSEEN